MRYRLRTLMIVLAIAMPILGLAAWRSYCQRQPAPTVKRDAERPPNEVIKEYVELRDRLN
jgi:hypothetical protein